ncbi:hypothetical protein MINS_20200 [Mycolicibacterium insubricum]|uniref:Uncharacterized protein n=1 Tax=Mycolicibacterium insubricum TaxID=444597 RepID=A0A1X0DIJ9_9MYCO|nr:hypothetical protein BST26_06040 [Mycolicibacterium insubricum]BBZ66591.1 hypothetical protein MINS_20200 [Mycolicibacterium insubricum]
MPGGDATRAGPVGARCRPRRPRRGTGRFDAGGAYLPDGARLPVDGYRIPAGTLLIYGIYAVQRDPALWERAEEFDPQRFLGPGARAYDRWQYIPFGAGPRSCIGDHFAMLEATLALATIVRRVELTSGEDDFPLALPFTMVAGAPIPTGCRRRAAA